MSASTWCSRRAGQTTSAAASRRAGRQVEDVQVGGTPEMRNRFLRANERAANVHLVHEVEALHRRVERASQRNGGGVVDEDVDAAEMRSRLLDSSLHLRFVANVHGDRQGASWRLLDLLSRGVDDHRQLRMRLGGLTAMTTFAPSRAARIAMAFPMPRLAPVMNSVFPKGSFCRLQSKVVSFRVQSISPSSGRETKRPATLRRRAFIEGETEAEDWRTAYST